MKNLAKSFFIVTTLFIVLLQIDFLRITDIYFFDGIYLLVVSLIISYPFIKIEKKIKNICLIAVFSMNFGFFVLFPVSYERSVTVQLLTNLSEIDRSKVISEDYIKTEIIKITETQKFTEKRIIEQLYTGYILETDDGYKVSKSINNFIRLKNTISKIYDFLFFANFKLF